MGVGVLFIANPPLNMKKHSLILLQNDKKRNNFLKILDKCRKKAYKYVCKVVLCNNIEKCYMKNDTGNLYH